MPWYTYKDPDTDKTEDFNLPMDHKPPSKNGKPMIRVYKPVNINIGKPIHKAQIDVDKWDQDLINYKEY